MAAAEEVVRAGVQGLRIRPEVNRARGGRSDRGYDRRPARLARQVDEEVVSGEGEVGGVILRYYRICIPFIMFQNSIN